MTTNYEGGLSIMLPGVLDKVGFHNILYEGGV